VRFEAWLNLTCFLRFHHGSVEQTLRAYNLSRSVACWALSRRSASFRPQGRDVIIIFFILAIVPPSLRVAVVHPNQIGIYGLDKGVVWESYFQPISTCQSLASSITPGVPSVR
jgi:hypothetical protein